MQIKLGRGSQPRPNYFVRNTRQLLLYELSLLKIISTRLYARPHLI